MDTTIVPSPAGKRGRNSSVILNDRLCEKRVAKRSKFYDRKCPGLYVSITTAAPLSFGSSSQIIWMLCSMCPSRPMICTRYSSICCPLSQTTGHQLKRRYSSGACRPGDVSHPST